MREGFETLVERFFQDDPLAQKELNNILSQSFHKLSLKLQDDEVAYLAQQSESTENHAASNYIKGCLSYLKKEYLEAIRFYNMAIQLGNAAAMLNRACMHKNGQGGAVNYPEAIKLHDMAIELGFASAMVNRAYMHQYGQGGAVNSPEAIKLFDMAILLGDASAMNSRACMHEYGDGGTVNYPQAIRLYDMAITLGNAYAMNNRACMHCNGHGGAVNYPQAARLYRQSSHPVALRHLKAIETSTYLWFSLSRQEYQTVIYHCAAADKKLDLFLTKNPTAIDIFLKDDLLKKEERDAILTTLGEQFFLPNIACFTQSIIDTLNSLKEASIGLPDFTTLQDKSPFTIEEKHLSPLVTHLSANLTQIGIDARAVLTQEYQRLSSTRATAVVSLENQNPSVALTNTSSLATRDELPSSANVPTSSTWRLSQNPLGYLWTNNKSTIFQTDRNTKETELMPLVSKGPIHTYGATED